MKRTLSLLLAVACAPAVFAQELSQTPGVDRVVAQMKAANVVSAGGLKAKVWPFGTQTGRSYELGYGLDPVTGVDLSVPRELVLRAMVSSCGGRMGVTLPLAVKESRDAVVAGVVTVFPKGYACGGIGVPQTFAVANPLNKKRPAVVHFAGTGGYALAESKVTRASGDSIEVTVMVRSGDAVVGAFAIDASRIAGRPTVVVGAIIMEAPAQPGVARPAHVFADRLTVRNPVFAGGRALDVYSASR